MDRMPWFFFCFLIHLFLIISVDINLQQILKSYSYFQSIFLNEFSCVQKERWEYDHKALIFPPKNTLNYCSQIVLVLQFLLQPEVKPEIFLKGDWINFNKIPINLKPHKQQGFSIAIVAVIVHISGRQQNTCLETRKLLSTWLLKLLYFSAVDHVQFLYFVK
eukprot:TRINITY_DN581_c0_g2_i1.p2 TRINITY_DN581_c0_g2~~TRINITY_DN581_c0_g2_i1.p2  ORF type:complete len:162 (-),score=0.61 TRINITY_DN581_c0_g2_i1:661-1146(-)